MNAPQEMDVDHRFHNTLDNRRCNIRTCTTAQNQHNQRKTRGLSQYKGVSWHKTNKKWQALIRLNGQRIYLGYFNNEIDAAKAYDKKARELFREFAFTNF